MPDVWLGNGTIRTLAEAGARLFVSLVFFFFKYSNQQNKNNAYISLVFSSVVLEFLLVQAPPPFCNIRDGNEGIVHGSWKES